MLPAFLTSQRTAASTVVRYFSSAPVTAPKAAQQRAVVLKLLTLKMVSPQPPSAFAFFASQSSPAEIRARLSAPADGPASGSDISFPPLDFGLWTFDSPPTTASAFPAVAVQTPLPASSPLH